MSNNAILIQTDLTVVRFDLGTAGASTLKALRRALGADIVGSIQLTDKADMWHDDEYLFTQPRRNHIAERIADMHDTGISRINGPVVITGFDRHGSTTGLSDEQAQHWQNTAQKLAEQHRAELRDTIRLLAR